MSRHSTNTRHALASRGVKPVNKLARRAARWVVKHAGQTARIRGRLPGAAAEMERRQGELKALAERARQQLAEETAGIEGSVIRDIKERFDAEFDRMGDAPALANPLRLDQNGQLEVP